MLKQNFRRAFCRVRLTTHVAHFDPPRVLNGPIVILVYFPDSTPPLLLVNIPWVNLILNFVSGVPIWESGVKPGEAIQRVLEDDFSNRRSDGKQYQLNGSPMLARVVVLRLRMKDMNSACDSTSSTPSCESRSYHVGEALL